MLQSSLYCQPLEVLPYELRTGGGVAATVYQKRRRARLPPELCMQVLTHERPKVGVEEEDVALLPTLALDSQCTLFQTQTIDCCIGETCTRPNPVSMRTSVATSSVSAIRWTSGQRVGDHLVRVRLRRVKPGTGRESSGQAAYRAPGEIPG